MGELRRDLHLPSAAADRAHTQTQQRAAVRVIVRRYAMGMPAADARGLLDVLGLLGTAEAMGARGRVVGVTSDGPYCPAPAGQNGSDANQGEIPCREDRKRFQSDQPEVLMPHGPYRCGGCDNTWTGLRTCHCSAEKCHRTFAGIDLFDRHRVATGERGSCVDPAIITDDDGQPVMFLRNGVWRGSDASEDELAARTQRQVADMHRGRS